jgi:hypothetical protein
VQMGWGDSRQTGHMTRRRGKGENYLFGCAAQTGQKKAKKRAVQAAVCEKKGEEVREQMQFRGVEG